MLKVISVVTKSFVMWPMHEDLAIKFSVARTRPKRLDRQVREAVQLANLDSSSTPTGNSWPRRFKLPKLFIINLLIDGRNRGNVELIRQFF